MSIHQPGTVAEFVDGMDEHRRSQEAALNIALPGDLAAMAAEVGQRTREALGIPHDGLVIILGEQTYGPGPQKVAGKRLLGNAASRYAGVTVVELFASQDALGSEPDITNFRLPNPQPAVGTIAVNMLPNWRRSAHLATAATASPDTSHVEKMSSTIAGLYPQRAAAAFLVRMGTAYANHPNNYGAANAEMLRDYEETLGIAGDVMVHDGQLETLIAQNGGLQVMMALWPAFVTAARKHAIEGVRVPDTDEAPFYLYHQDCGGRMNVRTMTSDPAAAGLETHVAAQCLHCKHSEAVTLGEIIDSGRTLSFRAMARVAAYSLFGIADGHVTGGGSIYNAPTEAALKDLGLPYYPLMYMSKVDGQGQHTALFQYESGTTRRKKASTLAGYEAAKQQVREGRVSIADLEISTSAEAVRAGIEDAMRDPGAFNTHSRIVVPLDREKSDEA